MVNKLLVILLHVLCFLVSSLYFYYCIFGCLIWNQENAEMDVSCCFYCSKFLVLPTCFMGSSCSFLWGSSWDCLLWKLCNFVFLISLIFPSWITLIFFSWVFLLFWSFSLSLLIDHCLYWWNLARDTEFDLMGAAQHLCFCLFNYLPIIELTVLMIMLGTKIYASHFQLLYHNSCYFQVLAFSGRWPICEKLD